MNVQNRFFKIALSRAASLAENPRQILSLLTDFALKIQNTKGAFTIRQKIRDQFLDVGRMVKAHSEGVYKIESTKLLITLLAVVIYFVNPFDLIPDFIFGIGFTDDFAVLAWFYKSAAEEIQDFKNWEKSRQGSSLQAGI